VRGKLRIDPASACSNQHSLSVRGRWAGSETASVSWNGARNRASRCAACSSVMPQQARSSSPSSCGQLNGRPSAVPWISSSCWRSSISTVRSTMTRLPSLVSRSSSSPLPPGRPRWRPPVAETGDWRRSRNVAGCPRRQRSKPATGDRRRTDTGSDLLRITVDEPGPLPQQVEVKTGAQLRPINRWISWVRPESFNSSRGCRVGMDAGSRRTSALSQPLPLPRRQGGTRSSRRTLQSPRVLPVCIAASAN